MKEFIVISYSLFGLHKKQFQAGDVVTQANFSTPVDQLVKDGFIVLKEEEAEKAAETASPTVETVEASATQETAAAVEETSEETEEAKADETAKEVPEIPAYDKITRKEILNNYLNKLEGVEFDSSKDKKTLYGVLEQNWDKAHLLG